MNFPFSTEKVTLTNSLNNDVCVEKIGNRFNLVLVASLRAREIAHGSRKLVNTPNGNIVSALQEIEAGLVGPEYLEKFKKV